MNKYLIDYPVNKTNVGVFKSDKEGQCILNVFMNKYSLQEFCNLNICFGVSFFAKSNISTAELNYIHYETLSRPFYKIKLSKSNTKKLNESLHCWLEDKENNVYDCYLLDSSKRYEKVPKKILEENNIYYFKYNHLCQNLLYKWAKKTIVNSKYFINC